MTTSLNIVLIGLRGSGKTTTGRRLAAELDHAFADLDEATARELGAPDAGAAIRTAGLTAFREAEARALETALDTDRTVLALGGGTPTAPGAEPLLNDARRRARALVVYLHAEPETLCRRTARDATDRPALVNAPPLAEARQLYEERDARYRALADLVLDVDDLDPDRAAEAIARSLAIA